MRRIQDTEGYLMIDHRAGDPVPDDEMRRLGLPVGAGRGLFETATYTCKHCQRIVVINSLRTRERAVCRGCRSVICDECAAHRAITGKCVTFDQLADEALETAAKRDDSPAPSIILPS